MVEPPLESERQATAAAWASRTIAKQDTLEVSNGSNKVLLESKEGFHALKQHPAQGDTSLGMIAAAVATTGNPTPSGLQNGSEKCGAPRPIHVASTPPISSRPSSLPPRAAGIEIALLRAVCATWPQQDTDDEEYLAAAMGFLLICTLDHTGQLPPCRYISVLA